MSTYRSFTVNKALDKTEYEQVMLPYAKLESNDLLIEVRYTGLSGLDALVINGGHPGVSYPIQPGFDSVGVVVESKVPSFSKGDEVTINGGGAGLEFPGGFSSVLSVPESMVLPIPMGLTMEDAITLGTPALAAGMALNFFLSSGLTPQNSKIAVTGATNDAGALMLALLHRLGFNVSAYTANFDNAEDYLKQLGAKEILPLKNLENTDDVLLYEPTYHAAFDNAGGKSLSGILKYMHIGSGIAVGACLSENSEISMLPFHCRGVNLLGINALYMPLQAKLDIWRRLSGDWKLEDIEWLSTEISLDELSDYLPALEAGTTKGRIIINHSL